MRTAPIRATLSVDDQVVWRYRGRLGPTLVHSMRKGYPPPSEPSWAGLTKRRMR